MKTAFLAAMVLALLAPPAYSASVSKTYTYFSIGGKTLEEIEKELDRRGPSVQSSGKRHPGATRMEFTTRVSYGERNGRCSVMDAKVTVKANMILPRWNRRKGSDQDTRLIWDTLSSDIKRHEESHVIIAKNHARELEEALHHIRNQRSCEVAAQKAKDLSERILAQHDRAQEEFDRVEGINFESRLLRLLRYRLEQIEAGRIPG
ncbi:DUF922 domain-containing protein [Aquamicrobium sp. LC103]|uniref:DUF922 domain-containing Zn-dependent protease n=1 Tax=Aquamicrobium sp. LC103 TaxID=1120658 RepID=UPI00063E9D34|nr:DUF922 domain-containing protein [Aquamicrobium sp. LC103]TKT76869.1 DUF922 domain-containing protein [Aquamicrobium sp. LC103]